MHNVINDVGEWMPMISEDAKRLTLKYMRDHPGPYDSEDINHILGTAAPKNPQMIERLFQEDWSGQSKIKAEAAKRQVRGYLAVYIIKVVNNNGGLISEYPDFDIFLSVSEKEMEIMAFEPKVRMNRMPTGSVEFIQNEL